MPAVLAKINALTKEQFIIMIDEWDCLFREDKYNEKLQKEYINLLRGLFKGTPSGAFLKLAYITGILPIKKYGTQSVLNNFREHTMVSPQNMLAFLKSIKEMFYLLESIMIRKTRCLQSPAARRHFPDHKVFTGRHIRIISWQTNDSSEGSSGSRWSSF